MCLCFRLHALCLFSWAASWIIIEFDSEVLTEQVLKNNTGTINNQCVCYLPATNDGTGMTNRLFELQLERVVVVSYHCWESCDRKCCHIHQNVNK